MSETQSLAPNESFTDAMGVVLVVSPKAELRAMAMQLVPPQIPVFEAEDLAKAKALIPCLPNGADCVLIDAPSSSEAASALRELRIAAPTPTPPLLVLFQAGATEDDQLRAMESGATDALIMPVGLRYLAARVRVLSLRARREREISWRLERALENATVDPLTGLFNRRQFERRLREEAAHARRHQKAFSLVMLDLDHFKAVNDTYGHEEGDRVLSLVAAVLKASLREDDTAFRYGGEEFVLLLRSCGSRAARLVTERARQQLRHRPLALGGAPARAITFSAGIASAEEANAFLTEDVVARADAAMYRAKRAGRDRIEAEESPQGSVAPVSPRA